MVSFIASLLSPKGSNDFITVELEKQNEEGRDEGQRFPTGKGSCAHSRGKQCMNVLIPRDKQVFDDGSS